MIPSFTIVSGSCSLPLFGRVLVPSKSSSCWCLVAFLPWWGRLQNSLCSLPVLVRVADRGGNFVVCCVFLIKYTGFEIVWVVWCPECYEIMLRDWKFNKHDYCFRLWLPLAKVCDVNVMVEERGFVFCTGNFQKHHSDFGTWNFSWGWGPAVTQML